MCLLLRPSRDELRPPTQRLLPSPAAGAHGRVPTHEDAQEDPGTLVVRVLRHLRQDGPTHLHGKRVWSGGALLTSAGTRLTACDASVCALAFEEPIQSDFSDIVERLSVCLESPLVCCVCV